MKISVLYFAWIRERIGLPSEEIETEAKTVRQLIDILREREERYSVAFEDLAAIRIACDQVLCAPEQSLAGVKEVAFFPPMTGG